MQTERNRACKHVQAVRGAFAVQREKLVSLRKEARTLNKAIKVLEVGPWHCSLVVYRMQGADGGLSGL